MLRTLAVALSLSLAACAAAPAPPPAAPSPAPAATAPPGSCAAANPGMRSYFMAFLYRAPAWSPEPSPAGEGHMQHIRDLAAAGQLYLAGPFDQPPEARDALAGIYVLTVPTLAEARALVEADPAVRAGRFRYEILAWYGPRALVCVLDVPAAK